MNFFKQTIPATFQSRPNRFVIRCKLEKGEIADAYLPNPGRLMELLIPGVQLYLEKSSVTTRKYSLTAVAVKKDKIIVPLHTHLTNDFVEKLIREGQIPELEEFRILRREVTCGKSRFDFKLESEHVTVLLEVKTVSLFGEKMAMFPDAPTIRGLRHIKELASLSQSGLAGAVLFVIATSSVDYFLPEFHTDPKFAEGLLSVRDKIKIMAIAVDFDEQLSLLPQTRPLTIPWKILERESGDSGCYLLCLKIDQNIRIEIGKLGILSFQKGYYIYVGSAKKNLRTRMERHKKLKKKLFWHIDYLRAASEFISVFPIRSSEDLECRLSKSIEQLSHWAVKGFGSSDCRCAQHLYGFNENPVRTKSFQILMQYYRIDRLLEKRIERQDLQA